MGGWSRLLAREKAAAARHREVLAGAPLAERVTPGSFLHGLLLPFSLIASALRDPELRGPYLRVTAIRGLVIIAVGALLLSSGGSPKPPKPSGISVHPRVNEQPVAVHVPGVDIELGKPKGENHVRVLGQSVPVHELEDEEAAAKTTAATHDEKSPSSDVPTEGREEPEGASSADAASTSRLGRVVDFVARSWAYLLALIGLFSGVEFVIVALSRRHDDWLSFHAARIAGVLPEDEAPPEPGVALDVPWIKRKIARRVRGYLVFAAGVPMLIVLGLVPVVGSWLFRLGLVVWGWYWLGVFSAGKTAHAWVDAEGAPPPLPIRVVTSSVPQRWWSGPLHAYTRVWARITAPVNPPVAPFERTPAAFLGLALARAVLSLPGLYVLARPLIPVAASRLCAEADPAGRFFSRKPAISKAADRTGFDDAIGMHATPEAQT